MCFLFHHYSVSLSHAAHAACDDAGVCVRCCVPLLHLPHAACDDGAACVSTTTLGTHPMLLVNLSHAACDDVAVIECAPTVGCRS